MNRISARSGAWLGIIAGIVGILLADGVYSATNAAPATNAPFSLDLAPHLNIKFSNPGYKGPGKAMPGELTLDGLPFVIKGQVSLFGKAQADRDIVLRERVEDIAVNRAFEELHLLHHAFWQDAQDETIATVRLRYADGTEHNFPIRYGAHVLDWFRLPSEDKETITDPQTKIVWRGEAPNAARLNSTLRLFKSTFTNPHPDKVVKSLDLISARKNGTYSLIAATVANRDASRPKTAPVIAMEWRRPFDGVLRLKVVDARTDKPIEGALIDPSMSVDDVGVVAPQVKSASTGEAEVRYLRGNTVELSLEVSRPGYRRVEFGWNAGQIPAELTVRLQGSTNVIGGLVKDDNGRPIAGVTVSFNDENDFSRPDSVTRTDALGRWRLVALSDKPEEHFIQLEHPDYVTTVYTTDGQAVIGPHTTSFTELREQTAELKLRRSHPLSGEVRNANGEPIIGARVVVASATPPPRLQTDASGKFTIRGLPGGRHTLAVQAPNCAPGMRDIFLGADSDPVKFTLEKGHVLKGRVVDPAGKPIAEARVTVENWRGKQVLQWSAITDADGRFQWGAAPADDATISISKPGYVPLPNIKFKANGELETFKLAPQPPPGFKGKVFDAV